MDKQLQAAVEVGHFGYLYFDQMTAAAAAASIGHNSKPAFGAALVFAFALQAGLDCDVAVGSAVNSAEVVAVAAVLAA